MNNIEDDVKVVLSGLGITAGYLLASYGVQGAKQSVVPFYNNELRNKVNESCGVELSINQWAELLKTEEWMKFRQSLPPLSWWERVKKLLKPALIFSAGSTMIGGSLDLGLSAFFNFDGLKGVFTLTATAAVILYGRLVYFKEASEGFVQLDGNKLSPFHPVCIAASNLAGQKIMKFVPANEVNYAAGVQQRPYGTAVGMNSGAPVTQTQNFPGITILVNQAPMPFVQPSFVIPATIH
jgi:hypothetical protein